MKVLFVSSSHSNFFAVDPVLRDLFRRGHRAALIVGMQKKNNLPDDALQQAQKDLPQLVVQPLSTRRFLRGFTRTLREMLNYAHVLNNEETRPWDAAKWNRFFHPFLWRILSSPRGKAGLKDDSFQKRLRAVEQSIPVDSAIRAEIQKHTPDLVVLLPLINPQPLEAEYLRAARSLGIPTVYFMVSWDNISTKGTFHGQSDYAIVWNEPLAEELRRLHDFPRDRIYITGAPRFAHLIDGSDGQVQSREAFCRQAGLDANNPFILYVGSTFLVSSGYKKEIDESILIVEAARALAENSRTSQVNILVRPHPLNSSFVPQLLVQGLKNVFVYPNNGEIPDTAEKQERYYNTIRHAMAVVGVNTTAFLESAALDKPCIAIFSERFSETQELPHFHHLTDAGFLETAEGVEGLAQIVGNIGQGADSRANERRAFVRNFLAPREKNAGRVCVDVLEEIAAKTAVWKAL